MENHKILDPIEQDCTTTTFNTLQGDKNLRNPAYLRYLIEKISYRITMLRNQPDDIQKQAADSLQCMLDDLHHAAQNPNESVEETQCGILSDPWKTEFPQLSEAIMNCKGNTAERRFVHDLNKLVNFCCHIYATPDNTALCNNQAVLVRLGNLALQQQDPEIAFLLVEAGRYIGKMQLVISKWLGHADKLTSPEFVALLTTRLPSMDKFLMSACTEYLNLAKEAMADAFILAFAHHKNQDWLWDRMVEIHKHDLSNPADIVEVGLFVFRSEFPDEWPDILSAGEQFLGAVQMIEQSAAEYKLENGAAMAFFYPAAQVIEHCADRVVKTYAPLHSGWWDDLEGLEDGDDYFEQTFDDPRYLRHLTTDYENRNKAACAADAYTKAYAAIIAERAEQLSLSVQEPSLLIDKTYHINEGLQKKYSWLVDLCVVRGNRAQIRLFDEVQTNVMRTITLAREFDLDPVMQENLPMIMQMNAAALIQEDPAIAFNLVETGYHLASHCAILASKMNPINRMAGIGSNRHAKLYAKHLVELFTDPRDTFSKDIATLFELSKASFSAAFVAAFFNHEEREELRKQIELISGHQADKDPQNMFAAAMQFFMPVPTFVAIDKVAKRTKLKKLWRR